MKIAPLPWTGFFLTLLDKTPSLDETLLMLLELEPGAVITIISDLGSVDCRKLLDIQYLMSSGQDIDR